MSADSPAAIIFSEAGQPVGVLFDGTIYRLQVSSTLTDISGNPVSITNGALAVTQLSVDGYITSQPVSTTDVLLLPANPNRHGVFIVNNTVSAVLFLGLSSQTVSNSLFSVEISAGGFFEIPFGYIGEIRGIWSVDEPTAMVLLTELT
jgi:hypothetical protein